MPDLTGSTSKNKVIWLKRMSLSLIRSRHLVVCQKTTKWNCGGIQRITWRDLWIFKFFIRDYEEFPFYSCSIDVPILSYGQICSGLRFGAGPAISYTTGRTLDRCQSSSQVALAFMDTYAPMCSHSDDERQNDG
jgi:hypothetical protein